MYKIVLSKCDCKYTKKLQNTTDNTCRYVLIEYCFAILLFLHKKTYNSRMSDWMISSCRFLCIREIIFCVLAQKI